MKSRNRLYSLTTKNNKESFSRSGVLFKGIPKNISFLATRINFSAPIEETTTTLDKNQNTEQKIIRACIKGDRKAQYLLYNEYKVFLYGVCLRYAKSKVEAEDILQEGFYKIFKDLKSWSGEGVLRAWMRKVMVNTALMHIRKYRKMEFAELSEVLPDDPNLILDFSQKDRANAIIKMIQQLPDPYQTVFNLRAMEGYSFREISQKLGSNEATLRSHYLRARSKLRKILEREFKED